MQNLVMYYIYSQAYITKFERRCIMENYGERLRKFREKAHMSQLELSKASGISRVAIADIERGKTKEAKISTLRAIANALNLSVEEIFLS